MLAETSVPNGVATARPPAKAAPPESVWHGMQSPAMTRYRPAATRAGGNRDGEVDAGGSARLVLGWPTALPTSAVASDSAAAARSTPRRIRRGPVVPAP